MTSQSKSKDGVKTGCFSLTTFCLTLDIIFIHLDSGWGKRTSRNRCCLTVGNFVGN